MTSESVEQIMLLKYYNHIMNLNSEKTIIEAWNIYCKEEDKDNAIDESYWKNRVNSITYDEICLDCEEKSQTALSIYCHAWQSRDTQLYLWR